MGKHKHHRRSTGDYNNSSQSYGMGDLGLGNLGSIFENFDLNGIISLLNKVDMKTLMPMINNIMSGLGNLGGNLGGNTGNNLMNNLLQNMNNNNNIGDNNINVDNNDLKNIIDQFSQYYNANPQGKIDDEIEEEGYEQPNVISTLSDYGNTYDDEVVKLLQSIKDIASDENIDKIEKIIQKYIEEDE